MKKLYKERWNKKFLGVLGGLGQFFKIDPNILRVLFIFFLFPTGLIFLPILYFLFAFFMPDGPVCFVQPTYKRLYLSQKNRLFSGVLSGLSEYLKIDVSLIRISFVALFFFSLFLPAFLSYVAASILIPNKPNSW